MLDIHKAREFINALSEQELDDDELIQKSHQFFSEHCSEIEATFINSLLTAKAAEDGKAPQVIEEYAYKGSPTAQLSIGVLKLQGQGVEQNMAEGIFWLKRAYIGKNPKSGLILANIYANGIGVQENMMKCREYMKGSADLGVAKAQYFYAGMLLEGEGGPVDEASAIDYMVLAAENGYEEAIEFLTVNGLVE